MPGRTSSKLDQPTVSATLLEQEAKKHSYTEWRTKEALVEKQQQTRAKLYVGNLGDDPPPKSLLESTFGYYGRLEHIWLARNPPGFAYVEFEKDIDAKDAAKALDAQIDTLDPTQRMAYEAITRWASERAQWNT